MIVTIDGPAGAGKSTVAKLLARRLGVAFLDTGAMYRAVTLLALRSGIDARDEAGVQKILASLDLEMPEGKVFANGEDVTAEIRSVEVNRTVSSFASSQAVRSALVELQRRFAGNKSLVTEGRDQGTVVFPQAELKVYLTADESARARRRYHELTAQGKNVSLDDVRTDQQRRDDIDQTRLHAPLRPADDAVHLDTTSLSIDEVVEKLASLALERSK